MVLPVCSTGYPAPWSSGTLLAAPMAKGDPCAFPECGRASVNRGLCGAHAYQRRIGKALRPIQVKLPRQKGRVCDYPGCGRPHSSGGLCHAHAAQHKKGKDLAPIRTRSELGAPRACGYPDCGRTSLCRGLCEAHVVQLRQGKELAPIRPRRTGDPTEEQVTEATRLWAAGAQVQQIRTQLGLGKDQLRTVMKRITDTPHAHANVARELRRWTSAEIAVAADVSLTIEEVMEAIGRTRGAVETMRKAIAHPKHAAHKRAQALLARVVPPLAEDGTYGVQG